MPRRPDVPCAVCGELMWRGRGTLPPGRSTCRPCRAKSSRRPHRRCAWCAWPVTSRQAERYCSTVCANQANGSSRPSPSCEVCGQGYRRTYPEQRTCGLPCGVILRGHRLGPPEPRDMAYTCQFCAGSFSEPARPGNVRTTCPSQACQLRLRQTLNRQWAVAHPDRILEASARRRVRIRAGTTERVDLLAIAERDGWRCQICRRRVNAALRYPHPLSRSYDHVVPVSEHPEHTAANLRLTHLRCNVGRGNRGGGEQLALIG